MRHNLLAWQKGGDPIVPCIAEIVDVLRRMRRGARFTYMAHLHIMFFGATPSAGANCIIPAFDAKLTDTIFIEPGRVFVVWVVEPV